MTRWIAALLVCAGAGAVTPAAQPPTAPDVRLVLLIAVDQFRYDYLTRFRGEYQGGIERLLTNGAVFTDAHLEHYPTVTAVGHATMLTGAMPSVNGIIGNDWFDRESGASVASITDRTVRPVGADTGSQASPRRLLVSTLGDEIKMKSPHSRGSADAPRVIGLSLKDRSAILTAGRAADAAYWWDGQSGRFVSSTYYFDELPRWVQAFNDRQIADSYAGKHWTSLSDPSVILREMPAEPGPALYGAVNGSAYGNDLLAALAEEALVHERLGQRGTTDVLTVCFSSNDSVGHTHGPDSAHVRDISIRTDRVIGQLLAQVDTLVGLQHTIVAFTTDHGVAPVPEHLEERGLPGGRMTSKDLSGPIEEALEKRYRRGEWVIGMAGSSPYLNHDLIEGLRLDPAEVRQVAATAAAAVPRVSRVYTRDQLIRGEVPNDLLGRRVLNGFHAGRSGDLEILLEPYWIRSSSGTTHGTPYVYDAHIPFILMGPRIKAGEYGRHVALNDLAPTLATLLGVAAPAGSSGRVLTEALEPRHADQPPLTH
jgi:predicted AlkP superfamily pyrophosphatase or phosphodiesterase